MRRCLSTPCNTRLKLFIISWLLLLANSGCAPRPHQVKTYEPLSFQVTGTYFEGNNQTILSVRQREAGLSVMETGNAQLNDSIILKYGEAKQETSQPNDVSRKGPETSKTPPPKGFGPPPDLATGQRIVGPDGPGRDMPGSPGTPPGKPPEMAKPTSSRPKVGQYTSAVFVAENSSVNLSNVRILTSLREGKGLCAIGQNARISAAETTIMTDGESSHGLFVAEGGYAAIREMTIFTAGDHSSAIATDQGGGQIKVQGGDYMVTGKYSAGVYSTGEIRVSDANITASADNAVVIEGGSSAAFEECRILSHQKGAVMIYQSFSGDAKMGQSSFSMTGGTVTALQGPLFYITNTSGKINLNNVALNSSEGILVKALKGDWGVDLPDAKPSRGATVEMVASQQSLSGDIIVDEFSALSIKMTDHSSLNSTINPKGTGKVDISLDKTSSWEVSADSYIETLTLPPDTLPKLCKHLIGNGHTIYYNPDKNPQFKGKTFPLFQGGSLRPSNK